MTSMKDEIAKINRDSEKIRAITKEIKADMTPDTKPVDGLGEATERVWILDEGIIYCLREGINDLSIHVNAQPRDLVREQALLALLFTYLNNYDALTQRVKVLEEALGKIASQCRCSNDVHRESCETDSVDIARKALAEGGTRE